jgi:hypothetical protein
MTPCSCDERRQADALADLPQRIDLATIKEHADRLWQQRAAARPADEGGPVVAPMQLYRYPQVDRR